MKTRLVINVSVPVADAIILDGAAVVKLLNPGSSRIIQEYGEIMFVPYISALLEKAATRTLSGMCTCRSDSVNQTEEGGTHQRVAASTVKPNN